MCSILRTTNHSEEAENVGFAVQCVADVARVLLVSHSLSSVWSHSVHFTKCPMFRC